MVEFFPKLYSPYKRDEKMNVYPEVKSDFEWVFEEAEKVAAIEKLDGENMVVKFDSLIEPTGVYRRAGVKETDSDRREYNMGEVPMWGSEGARYTEGIANAYYKGWIQDYINEPGVYYGELVGPSVQGNRYDLDRHYWVPFRYARDKLEYNSYGEYGVDFEDLRSWIVGEERARLEPLFYSKIHGGVPFDEAYENSKPEGIVFVRENQTGNRDDWMAKLRRDMFEGVDGKHDR